MKYLITLDVITASGFQQFSVEAESPEEALAKFQNGGGLFEDQEVEVTELRTPSLADVQEV